MKKIITFLLLFMLYFPSVVIADCLPIYKEAFQTSAVKFDIKDFKEAFEGKSLCKIRFSILPEKYQGKLLFKGKNVKELQEIPIDKLKKLEFIPNKNYSGSVIFLWNGAEEGKSFCENPSTVTVFLKSENNPSQNTEKKKGVFEKIKDFFKI